MLEIGSHRQTGRLAISPVLFFLGALAGCATATPSSQYDPAVSEWRQGMGWRPVARGAGTPSADKLRAESREAYDSAQHRDALDGFLALRRRYPSSPEAKSVETAFNIAECYYALGAENYGDAYPYYREVLKGSPPEEILKTTLARVYDIGRSYLDGRARRKFLGIPYRSPSFGVEILLGPDGLVTNYPFLKDSEDALMEVARYYFEKREYAEAEHVFERLVRDYPQSTWNSTAEFQLAMSIFRQVKGLEYDQGLLRKAKSSFNLYLNNHPRGPQVEEARAHLKEIAEMEGRHDLTIARYYLRESQPRAAMLYLRQVIIANPKTDAAREAREIYENMERQRSRS